MIGFYCFLWSVLQKTIQIIQSHTHTHTLSLFHYLYIYIYIYYIYKSIYIYTYYPESVGNMVIRSGKSYERSIAVVLLFARLDRHTVEAELDYFDEIRLVNDPGLNLSPGVICCYSTSHFHLLVADQSGHTLMDDV